MVYPLSSAATTAITNTIDSNIESIEFDGYNYLIIYYKGNSKYVLFVWGANKYGAWLSSGLLYLHDPVNNWYEKVLGWDKGMVKYPLMYRFDKFISRYYIKTVPVFKFNGLDRVTLK
jgi:hypothetical protein